MKVIFISRYGSKNLGDELIVRELEKLLNDYVEEIYRFDFNLSSYGSLDESFDYSPHHPQSIKASNFINNLYRKHLRKTYLISVLRDYFNKKKAIKNKNLISYRKKIEEVDALIIGGGNAIFDTERSSSSAFYFGLMLKEAKKKGKPIFVINVGIGPFQTKSQINKTIEVLDMANYVTVRDRKSYDLVSELNKGQNKLFQTVDPVIFLQNNDKQESEIKTIGVNVMDIRLADYTDEIYEKYLLNLKKIINHYLENSKYNISVFCTEKLDVKAIEDLKLYMNIDSSRLEFINFMNLKNTLLLFDKLDFLVGTRMHSTIVALSQNIPFIGVSWQQKVTEFFKLTGFEENMVTLHELISDYSCAIKRTNELLRDYSKNKSKMKEKKKELKLMYNINIEVLEEIKSSIKYDK
ncbi:polysaccharide pyruvyl transferase family protein [Halalkalibacter suaedae]|uniref:Polysaccharide pyruvyl transferase family protein n=1 Tax=Halalkalibacter suaedae TaxID=2822140 RepID=A0A940X0R6_9BACI|nr:polysaccharide pyruvyl transferase family protein [Bacillus suaedae]MBP3953151.1 polysaccharide pyruvyl transferase family protein [Bacillus suaedae]